MVINQDITISSAEANFGNAVLARESAEYSLGQFTGTHYSPHAEVLRSEMSQVRIGADQSRLLANYEAEQANAGELIARMVQQLDEGTYSDAAIVAPSVIQTAIRHYIETLENHVVATQASRIAGAQGSLEKTRITLQGKIEETRGREHIKKMILDYEKAYLKSLKRARANVWW
ncbi:MAG: hypothetical protein ACHRXM_31925 [Isosphaerales bacterium]